MGECSDDANGPGRPPLPRKGAIRPRSNSKTSPQDDRSEPTSTSTSTSTRSRRQSAPMESTLSEKDSDDNSVVRSIPFTANDSHASLPPQNQQLQQQHQPPTVKLGTSRSRGKSPRRASEPINWERTNAASNSPRRAESSASLRDDSSTHSQSSVSSIKEKMQSFKMNADLPPAFKTARRSSMGDSGHTDISGGSSTQGNNGLPPLQPTAKRPPRSSKTIPPKENSSSFSLPPPPPPKNNFFVSPITGTKHIRNQEFEEDSSHHSNSVVDLESSQASLIQTPPPLNPKSNLKSSTSTSPRKRSSAVPNNGKDSTTPQQIKDPVPLMSQSPKIDDNLSEGRDGSRRASTTPVEASIVSPGSSNRFSMSNWRNLANVKLLPPGFQAMVESMRGPNTEVQETSPSTNLKPPPPLESRQQEDIRSLLAAGRIAELKQVFSKRNIMANIDTAVNDNTDDEVPQNQEPPTKNPHAVIMYERPDGFGEAATPTSQMANRSIEQDLDDLEDPNDPAGYEGLLASIAACKLDDRANRAGKVLKRMKEMKMPVSDITIILLRLCTEIPERVPEPKPQEVALRSILIEETHYTEGPNGEKTPLLAPTKRVRFADTNELRIIRRRRSIGSNERWDDPLTPPKRISAYVDVSVSRFSTGPRDDRPALPRRTNSMSSLLSGSSHSSDGSFSSSSTELDPPFKLPFGDSPELASRKSNSDSLKTPVQKLRKGLSKPATRLAGKRPTPPPVQDVPTAPTRKASMDMDLSPMAPTDEPPAPGPPPGEPVSPSVPPPPPADFPLETPPPPPRRRVQRRRSISGIERRADTPLTPPRRVSDKSDLYAAQVSLREARAPVDPGLQLPSARLRRPSVGSPIESFQKVENRPKEPRSPSQPEEAAPPLPQRKRSIMVSKAAPENSTPSVKNEPAPPPPPPPMDALEVSLAKARISAERTTSTSSHPHPPPPPPPPMEEPTARINKVERHREVIAEEWNVVDFGEDDADNGEQPPPPPPEGDAA